jgi:hypothetical protein
VRIRLVIDGKTLPSTAGSSAAVNVRMFAPSIPQISFVSSRPRPLKAIRDGNSLMVAHMPLTIARRISASFVTASS